MAISCWVVDAMFAPTTARMLGQGISPLNTMSSQWLMSHTPLPETRIARSSVV